MVAVSSTEYDLLGDISDDVKPSANNSSNTVENSYLVLKALYWITMN